MTDFDEFQFLHTALEYAKRGWAVLPLMPMTKKPLGALVPHGFQDATTKEEIIRQWWERYPSANVGVRTGAISGLVVLDIDPRNGGDGNLWELEQQNGELPPTVGSLTGGGGAHLFFLHPGGILKNRTIAPGVEVKADGAYVVVPPSIHPSGKSYIWECVSDPRDIPVSPLPKWVFRLCQSSLGNGSGAPSPIAIPKGRRNETLTKLAGAMRRQGTSEETIRQTLLAENLSRCTPPLDEHEVRKIAQSVARYDSAMTAESRGLNEWPGPLAKEAFHGLLGEIVTTIEPHSEADLAAILFQILVAFGSVLNRRPHFLVEADVHALNLFVVLVGQTARGRKGTSWGRVKQLFKLADPDWVAQRIHGGLSSGEGLIWHVRDPIYKEEPIREKREIVGYQTIRVDPGIEDKRLLILESEFALVLRILQRDGNILSAIIRQAWDNGDLRTMTKNNPVTATGAHISIIGHITQDELRRYLDATETANGFANRFLLAAVKRSKCLPEGGKLRDEDLEPLVHRLNAAIQFGRATGRIEFDEEARKMWCTIYPELSAGYPGLLGSVTSRADPMALRLSCLYALLDQSAQIRVEHLKAGMEVWRYSFDSARYVFQSASGDQVADRILKALQKHPEGMTRTEINAFFGNNRKSSEIERALAFLLSADLARTEEKDTGGRPETRWFANGITK